MSDKPQDARVVEQTQNQATNANANTNVQSQTSNNTNQGADASKVTPSEMTTHLGPPSIEHDYPEDSKHRRHSVSHQEQHYMR